MSLYQLQELASRQQEQIESTHRLIVNKEQRLNYLASVQDSQQGPIFDYDQNLGHFKEKLALQEAKIRKLQLLKGQIQKQRCSNSNICSEVETIKILFKEKERELTVALTKIDALTRQLDELKKGNIVNSYSINGYKHQSVELEKLRQELLHKNKLSKQHEEELIYKRNMLYKKQADMMKIDQKVTELKSRLARKRQLNQQQMTGSRGHSIDTDDLFASKTILRSSMGHPATYKVPYSKPSAATNTTSISQNIATVEPLQRLKGATLKQYDNSQAIDYGLSQANKQDSKYQTLPFNTKFGGRNANFTSTKQLEDSSSKVGSLNFAAMSEDCDSNGLNGQSANDISLIISHKSDSSKDTSLEERPSPSGSSGSSDRISSSMTAYSYDKMGLNGNSPDNRYFANLDKSYRRRADECGLAENGLYQPKYVPNMSANAAAKSANENGAKECSKSSSALDAFYKTKPSAPVKPIANEGDVVDNCRYDTNFMFNQKSHRSSGENSTLSTPTSGVYSSSEIFSPHDKNGSDLQMDFEEDYEDNLRNQQLEERSSVSEIVSRINNWTVSNGGPQDWEKMKRRPVVSANEMENELTQEANAKTAAAAAANSFNTSPNKDKPTSDNKENAKNSPERNHTKGISEQQQDLANNNSINTEHETDGSERKELSQKPKRIKGSLKSHDSTRTMKIPLSRRVSFDPLALLLDASLEGELELVKKTSHEVPNPSASNDEGITALHNATCAGHHDIVKYLVEIGCDVNVQDSDGWTPLHCAASCNNIVMIKFLVKSGACIFATTFSDHETAAEKCEEDEEGFDGCSQYLYGVQDQIGSINNGIVYALYDYESQNPDELNFKVGDGIQVLRKGDDQEKEWWWSRIGDYEGYVPRNLIGMYPRIAPSYK